jgi:4-amino-4-deoxy-L-arabinose transferase-like glycosyltransferase
MNQREIFSKRTFALLAIIGIALNATCFFSEVLEPDGALYATIAKHIANTNDWINLWGNGTDWLDKPHLPFWLTAVSFKIFGISAFSYKLPSFLCWLSGVLFCYKLAAKIYSVPVAQLATLIYITALHVILSNADVRAEGYLTAFILAATYYMYNAYVRNKFSDIVLTALFCAFSIMTKGIFTIVTIASGFIIYWIKNKEWHEFVKLKWYLLALLTFIFILPELYSLYTQFDLHPEKIVFGKTNVSGIRFFFWDSQFGRFVNNAPIKGSGDIFFFLHTTLWAFLPWSIILLTTLIISFKKIIRPSKNNYHLIIGSSALVTFLMFSFSRFQLPHYIVIIFPHIGMIVSYWMIEDASEKALKRLNIAQLILYVLFITIVVVIIEISAFSNIYVWLLFAVIVSLFAFSSSKQILLSITKKNIGFALLLAFFLNCIFYPSLLKYQAGMMAGKWMNENYEGKEATMFRCNSYTFEFYCKGNIARVDSTNILLNRSSQKDTLFVYTPLKELGSIQESELNEQVSVLKTFPNFHVSQVKYSFLNNETRENVLDTCTIVMLTKK